MTKKTNFKKHLLASASALAIGAFSAGQAGAVSYSIDTDVVSDPSAVLNYGADVVFTVADAVNLANAAGVTTATTGTGALAFSGTTTVTGPVGLTGTRLKLINAGAAGKIVTLSGDVFAVTTNVTNTGTLALSGNLTGTTLNYLGDGFVTLATGKTITAAVTTATTNTGTLTFAQTATMNGDIGTSTNKLKLVTIAGSGVGTTTASENIYATTVNFVQDGGLTIADGKTLNAAVTTTTTSQGTLTLTGSGAGLTTNITGALGTTTNLLKLITIGSAATHTVSASDNIFATTLNFATDSSLNVASGKNITAAVTTTTSGTGTIAFAGSSTVTGVLGNPAGNALKLITINSGTLTTTAGVAATTVNFASDGALVIAAGQTLKAAVTNTTSGQGTVTFAGAGTMTGALGAVGDVLKLVTVGKGAVAASSNIYATTVNFAGDNTLTVATGATVASNITTETTNTGTLDLAGTNILTGNVGTSSNLLKQVNIGTGGVTTTTLTGNIYATGLNFSTDSILSVAAGNSFTSSNTSTAAITTSGDNTGTLTFLGGTTLANIVGTKAAVLKAINFNGGTSNVSSSINAETTTVGTGATLNFTAATSHATNLVTAGTGTVNVGTTTTTLTAGTTTGAGNFTLGSASSTLATTINSATDNDSGKLVVAGTADLGNANVSVNVASTSYSAADSTYDIVSSTGVMSNTAVTVTDNSYIMNYTSSKVGNVLRLTSVRANTYQSAATLASAQNVGTALETIGSAGDAALDSLQGTLSSYTTASQIDTALKTLTPNNVASGSTSGAVLATSNAAMGVIENRMMTAMNGSTGVATGGRMNSNGLWGEVFGSKVDQDVRSGVDGYDATVGGLSFGADTLVNPQTRIGAAFAYGRTAAEGTGNKTDVDTYQGSIYGTYDMGQVYYEGLGTIGVNSYDTTRNLFNGSVATGSFNGMQYDAKAAANYRVDVKGGLKVTPFVSAEYALLTQDKYTETGSGANLTVDTDDINIFKTGIGSKLAYPIMDNGITYTPRMSAGYYYDFVGDKASSTANFTSATTTFVTKGASAARNSFRLGAGLDVLAQDNVTVSFDYNWDAKQAFNAHTGELKARFEF